MIANDANIPVLPFPGNIHANQEYNDGDDANAALSHRTLLLVGSDLTGAWVNVPGHGYYDVRSHNNNGEGIFVLSNGMVVGYIQGIISERFCRSMAKQIVVETRRITTMENTLTGVFTLKNDKTEQEPPMTKTITTSDYPTITTVQCTTGHEKGTTFDHR